MMTVHEPIRQHEKIADCVMFSGLRPRGDYDSVSWTAFAQTSIAEENSVEKSIIKRISFLKSSIEEQHC